MKPRLSEFTINNLTSDSRQVQPGDLFLAYPGFVADGRDYIFDAVQQGATAIFYDPKNFTLPDNITIPCVPMDNLQQQAGILAAEFYGYPSDAMDVVGVTGTNGKTTVTQFLAQGLQDCAVIGTTGVGFLPDLEPASHTTPDAITLQQQMSALKDQGAKRVAMEVSSHALDQGRVNGVSFDVAVFLNLSRDHLDYHPDMDAYAAAKFALFEQPTLKHAVINVDDAYGRQFLSALPAGMDVIAVSQQAAQVACPMVRALEVAQLPQGFSVEVQTPWGEALFTTTMLGRFNVDNILAFIAVLGILGYPLSDIVKKISRLQPAKGRMEMIHVLGKPAAVIDFAHTPDALQQTLNALRAHCNGKLYCVFGCGGDRDPGKRAMMGDVASALADHVIVTNDNPRSEDPQAIADEICKGMQQPAHFSVILDRKKAIAHAMQSAKPGDLVLVAGKGHETYQIIGDKTFPFADGEVVREQLQL